MNISSRIPHFSIKQLSCCVEGITFIKQILSITSKVKALHCLILIWPFCLVILCSMKKWIYTSSFKDSPHSHTFIIPSKTWSVCSWCWTEGALDTVLPCLCLSRGFITWQPSFEPWNGLIQFDSFVMSYMSSDSQRL